MRSISAAATVACLTLASLVATGSEGARAQQGSDQCLRLEAQLASTDRTRRADPRQIEQARGKQQYELDRTRSYARGIGCGQRFLFAPDPPAECGPLTDRIRKMEVNLDRLGAQAAQAAQGGGMDPRRRDLLFALARNQCGPQYRIVERRVQTEPQEKRGFFSMLFGGGGGSEAQREETVLEPQIVEPTVPRPTVSSGYRTVCVRTCDGFFFPVSYSAGKGAFARDEAICRATCPGAEAKLFAYPNPGGQIEQATGVDGEPYSELPNALRYRKEFVAGCSCKPDGMSWAEALAGVDDPTVKKGDIVVDEQKAEAMSRPQEKGAAPTAPTAQALPPRRERRPAPAEPEPFATEAPPPTGGTDDIIILDERQPRRGEIESRPLRSPD